MTSTGVIAGDYPQSHRHAQEIKIPLTPPLKKGAMKGSFSKGAGTKCLRILKCNVILNLFLRLKNFTKSNVRFTSQSSHFTKQNSPFPPFTKVSKLVAFTLAEVLITLGVIGIVAAMTIPSVLASYRKNVAETRLKHTYSMITQAIKLVETEHEMGFRLEIPDINGDENGYSWENSRDLYEMYFKKYIPAKVVWNNKNDFSKKKYYYYGNYNSSLNFDNNTYYFELGNGVLLGLVYDYRTGSMNWLIILNQNAKPIVAGRDYFVIRFTLANGGYRNSWYNTVTDQQLYDNCSTTTGRTLLRWLDQKGSCFEIIRRNSFNIPKNYPIPF